MEHKWNANGWNANGTQMERKWNAKLQNGTQMERKMYNYTELLSKLSPHEIPSKVYTRVLRGTSLFKDAYEYIYV